MTTKTPEEWQREVDAWKDTAAQHLRDEAWYRGILADIGKKFGLPAYTSDDGSVQDDVLILRVPELVDALRAERDAARAQAEASRRDAEQGWKAYRALSKAVAADKYPTLTNIVRLTDASAMQEPGRD